MRDDDRVGDQIFLETTRRLAPPRLADEDVRVALEALQPALGAAPRVADLGCGYGRHLAAFKKLGLRVTGVDRSALLLREASSIGYPLIRADLRALPLRERSLAGAVCFYSSMFLGSDEDARASLTQAARALEPGGRLVLTTDNPLRMAKDPRSRFEDDVPGLGRVLEESDYDAISKIDTVRRSVNGLSTVFRIRYYLTDELARMAASSGLQLLRAELGEDSPQLVAILQR